MQSGTKSRSRRGRPRAYDPEQVLRGAMDLFLLRGFSAPSIKELADAAGVNRPSLNAGFGDRRALYLAALEMFREDLRNRTADALAHPELRTALISFYEAIIEVYSGSGKAAAGCLVICTAPAETARDLSIREALNATLMEIDEGLTNRLRQGRSQGQSEGDPDALGPVLASLVHSMAIRARAGERADRLKEIAVAAVDRLI